MTDHQLKPKEITKLINKIIVMRRRLAAVLRKIKNAGKVTDGHRRVVIDLRDTIMNTKRILALNGCSEIELRKRIYEWNKKLRRNKKKGLSGKKKWLGKGFTEGGSGIYRVGSSAKFWR